MCFEVTPQVSNQFASFALTSSAACTKKASEKVLTADTCRQLPPRPNSNRIGCVYVCAVAAFGVVLVRTLAAPHHKRATTIRRDKKVKGPTVLVHLYRGGKQ